MLKKRISIDSEIAHDFLAYNKSKFIRRHKYYA